MWASVTFHSSTNDEMISSKNEIQIAKVKKIEVLYEKQMPPKWKTLMESEKELNIQQNWLVLQVHRKHIWDAARLPSLFFRSVVIEFLDLKVY